MRISVLFAPFCVSLLAGARGADAPPPIATEVARLFTIVENGGFERGGRLPAWWRRYPKSDQGGDYLRRDTTVAHSGQASGLICSSTRYRPGKPGMQWNYYFLPVHSNTELLLSAWVKTEGCLPARVGCHFYDAAKRHLSFQAAAFPPKQGEWVYLRAYVRAPRRAKWMGLALYANAQGKTWFDDVAVLGTPQTTAVRGTPRLDGRLDDSCWRPDRAITAFVAHTGDALAKEKTRAWVAYDDRALYVAFDCPHPPGAQLKADAKTHDGKVWLDDSIEIFLDPENRCDAEFQICVNCLGVTRDSTDLNVNWESGAQTAVRRTSAGWSVEVAIPFRSFGLSLGVGDTWGMNLVRNDRVNGQTATWSLGGFHRPGRFGRVVLKPNLWNALAPALRAELARRRAAAAQLEDKITALHLPPPAAARARREIARTRSLLQELDAMTAGKTPRPRWSAARAKLAAASDALSAARAAALRGLFDLQAPEGAGFRVAIGHSLQKIRRRGPVADGVLARQVKLSLARDESESFQLVVVPQAGALAGVSVDAPPLRGPGGELPLTWRRVGYVETARPKYPTAYVGWWPDPLLPPGRFDVKAGERQPLWFTVRAAPDAAPGTYRGVVTIRCAGAAVRTAVCARVRRFRLPRPGTLATAFGIYPQTISNGYARGPYRQKLPIKTYARWCEFLGRYRLSPKNAANDYVRIEKRGGEWTADLRALQHTVARLAPRYFAPYSFCLHRLPTNHALRNPKRPPNLDDWVRRTKAVAQAWKRMGLPRQVYIYGVDEPRREDYPALCKLYDQLHREVPGFPIMQTIGDPEPTALVGRVGIWCPLSARADVTNFYRQRLAAGDRLWIYVCCGPVHPYANFFIDRPAVEHRVLFWQARQVGATGFLYWCMTYWRGLPAPVTGPKCWPRVPFRLKDLATYRSYKVNGDGLLIYPGPDYTPYPSIRLEVIRDGVEDYEYLALISRLTRRAKARGVDAALVRRAQALCLVPASISQSMSEYTRRADPIFERRARVADAIEALQDALAAR